MSGAGVCESRPAMIAAAATERICALPAVATADWCDRAAGCLTAICPGGVAVVAITMRDGGGRLRPAEAIGLAADKARAAAQARPGAAELTHLRKRASRLREIGFAVSSADLTRGVCRRLPCGPDGQPKAADTPAAVWRDLGAGEVLVGAAALGTSSDSRVLLVHMSPTPEGASDALAAVLPVLRRRAAMAIGPSGNDRDRWITGMEQTVLEQLTLGRSVRQIAEMMERSPHTVHDHVKSLHRKLNASSRGELIARALGHIDHATRIRHTGAGGDEN